MGLPTLASGDTLALTLNDAATHTVYEILYVTAISGATITCSRGNEGTSAAAWSAGDLCFGALTAGELENIIPSTYVTTFNTRSGAVTLTAADVNGALGYTAANAANVVNTFNGRLGAVTLSATDVNGALGYTAANDAAVVHIAGAETVTGAKTFNALTIASGGLSLGSGGASSAPSGLAYGMWLESGGIVNLTANGTNYFTANAASASATIGAPTTVDGQITTSTGALSLGSTGVSSVPASGYGVYLLAGGSAVLAANGSAYVTADAATGGLTLNQATTVSGALTATTMNATGSDRRLKRNIRRVDPRPLHRAIRYVSFDRKADGSHGRGAIAQDARNTAPEYVGDFDWHGEKRLNFDYAGAGYEQAVWASTELDKALDRIKKLEARLRALERRV